MHIHLSKYEVISIRDAAAESAESEDGGEAFCEEAIGALEDADIELIEGRTGGDADEFMREIFEQWDGGDPIEVVEMMVEALAPLDVELTYEDEDVDEDELEEKEDEWTEDEDESFEDDDSFAY